MFFFVLIFEPLKNMKRIQNFYLGQVSCMVGFKKLKWRRFQAFEAYAFSVASQCQDLWSSNQDYHKLALQFSRLYKTANVHQGLYSSWVIQKKVAERLRCLLRSCLDDVLNPHVLLGHCGWHELPWSAFHAGGAPGESQLMKPIGFLSKDAFWQHRFQCYQHLTIWIFFVVLSSYSSYAAQIVVAFDSIKAKMTTEPSELLASSRRASCPTIAGSCACRRKTRQAQTDIGHSQQN